MRLVAVVVVVVAALLFCLGDANALACGGAGQTPCRLLRFKEVDTPTIPSVTGSKLSSSQKQQTLQKEQITDPALAQQEAQDILRLAKLKQALGDKVRKSMQETREAVKKLKEQVTHENQGSKDQGAVVEVVQGQQIVPAVIPNRGGSPPLVDEDGLVKVKTVPLRNVLPETDIIGSPHRTQLTDGQVDEIARQILVDSRQAKACGDGENCDLFLKKRCTQCGDDAAASPLS